MAGTGLLVLVSVEINDLKSLFTFNRRGRTEVLLEPVRRKPSFHAGDCSPTGRLAAKVTAEDQKHLPKLTLGIPFSVCSVQLVILELERIGLSSVQHRGSVSCFRRTEY